MVLTLRLVSRKRKCEIMWMNEEKVEIWVKSIGNRGWVPRFLHNKLTRWENIDKSDDNNSKIRSYARFLKSHTLKSNEHILPESWKTDQGGKIKHLLNQEISMKRTNFEKDLSYPIKRNSTGKPLHGKLQRDVQEIKVISRKLGFEDQQKWANIMVTIKYY